MQCKIMIKPSMAASKDAATHKRNMKKKILNTIYWILLAFVILIALVPTISTLNIKLPFKLFAVQTGSMEPTINTGDLILVKEKSTYLKGDIITFDLNNNKTPITHRIVAINSDGTFKTKGDANSGLDIDNVKTEEIIGAYFFRIPLIGHPMNFVKTPIGFIILIAIPAILISYEEFKKILNEIRSKKEQ